MAEKKKPKLSSDQYSAEKKQNASLTSISLRPRPFGTSTRGKLWKCVAILPLPHPPALSAAVHEDEIAVFTPTLMVGSIHALDWSAACISQSLFDHKSGIGTQRTQRPVLKLASLLHTKSQWYSRDALP